jgi:hypothetical protein
MPLSAYLDGHFVCAFRRLYGLPNMMICYRSFVRDGEVLLYTRCLPTHSKPLLTSIQPHITPHHYPQHNTDSSP